jgi:hypothetical protein
MEEGDRGYGTEGYSSRSDTYQGSQYDVNRDQGTAAGAGGGILAQAKEMLVDRPVEAVKVREGGGIGMLGRGGRGRYEPVA